MKKQLFLTAILIVVIGSTKLIGQATNPNNIRTLTNFIGYQAFPGPPGILQVRNDHNFPINFSTGPAQDERLRLIHRPSTASLLPGYPLSAPNPFPGNRLTRVSIPVDGAFPVTVPLAALHIGYNASGSLLNQAGFRDWMNVGVMCLEGSDNMYMGLREKTTPAVDPTGRTCTVNVSQTDNQDAVIAWGDNYTSPGFTPNNLTFIFNSIRTNSSPGYEFTNYGREVARMTPDGFMGIGPVFFDNAQPRNLLHVNNDLTNAAYVQISNANATGQTATDGFHLGVTAGPMATTGGIAQINQFEDRDMRFYTNNTFRMVIKDATTGFGRLGVNILTPGNRLTVNSSAADPGGGNVGNPGGSSGIRTSNMTTASPAMANPGLGVVSVDGNGDLIYVLAPPTGTGSGVGNYCTAPQNSLVANYEVPLGTFNYKFTGQGLIDNVNKQDIVSVGYPCAQQAPSRFSVLENQNNQPQNVQTYAGHFKNANIPTGIFSGAILETAGIYAETKSPIVGTPNKFNINIGGIFEGYGQLNNIGVVGRIAKSSTPLSNFISNRYNIGGAFMSDTTVTNNTTPFTDNFGVFARATNGNESKYGIYAVVDAANSGKISAAVYAKAPSPNPNFANPWGEYAGYFDGDVYVNGQFAFASDQALKQNVDTISNALTIIKLLKPKTFEYKLAQYPHMNLPSGQQYGLIAQDVQTVIPSIVTENVHPAKYDAQGNIINPSVNFKGLEYTQLIPVLIRAVQQLSDQNKKQDSLIQVLTQNISSCCSNTAARQTGVQGNDPKNLNQLNIELTDKDFIVLNQNQPNPFAEQTTITYNVPEKYGFAQLVFKTVDGKIIKTVDITKKGRGMVNVFASDLSNGLYMYSLIVDGEVIDTKKMVKQN